MGILKNFVTNVRAAINAEQTNNSQKNNISRDNTDECKKQDFLEKLKIARRKSEVYYYDNLDCFEFLKNAYSAMVGEKSEHKIVRNTIADVITDFDSGLDDSNNIFEFDVSLYYYDFLNGSDAGKSLQNSFSYNGLVSDAKSVLDSIKSTMMSESWIEICDKCGIERCSIVSESEFSISARVSSLIMLASIFESIGGLNVIVRNEYLRNFVLPDVDGNCVLSKTAEYLKCVIEDTEKVELLEEFRDEFEKKNMKR